MLKVRVLSIRYATTVYIEHLNTWILLSTWLCNLEEYLNEWGTARNQMTWTKSFGYFVIEWENHLCISYSTGNGLICILLDSTKLMHCFFSLRNMILEKQNFSNRSCRRLPFWKPVINTSLEQDCLGCESCLNVY